MPEDEQTYSFSLARSQRHPSPQCRPALDFRASLSIHKYVYSRMQCFCCVEADSHSCAQIKWFWTSALLMILNVLVTFLVSLSHSLLS